MKKVITYAALILVAGCASTGSSKTENQDLRPCAQNFTHDGNMLVGSKFKTSALVKNVNKESAFEKVSKYIAMDGWHITHSDKDLGMLSVSQKVSFGEGDTAPLNISIDAKEKDSVISISFATAMGVYSPPKSVMNSFCEMIASATK